MLPEPVTAPCLVQVCVRAHPHLSPAPHHDVFSDPTLSVPLRLAPTPPLSSAQSAGAQEEQESSCTICPSPPPQGSLKPGCCTCSSWVPVGLWVGWGGGQDGPGLPEARGWAQQAGFSFPQQTPGSHYLPSSLASCPSWPWSPPRPPPPPGLKPEEQVTRGLGQADRGSWHPATHIQPAPAPAFDLGLSRACVIQLLPVDIRWETTSPLCTQRTAPSLCPPLCLVSLSGQELFASEAISQCFVYTAALVAFVFLLL